MYTVKSDNYLINKWLIWTNDCCKITESNRHCVYVSLQHNSCAIHVASQGKKDIVQMLLNAGCNINAADDVSCTLSSLSLCSLTYYATLGGAFVRDQLLLTSQSSITLLGDRGKLYCQDLIILLLPLKHVSLCVVHLYSECGRESQGSSCSVQPIAISYCTWLWMAVLTDALEWPLTVETHAITSSHIKM